MKQQIEDFMIDVSHETSFRFIQAKQYDTNSRTRRLIITDSNYPIPFTGKELIILSLTKGDDNYSNTTCKFRDDGYPYVTFTDSMLEKEGRITADLKIFNSDEGSLLSTFSFGLEVYKSILNYDKIIKSSEFSFLNELILEASAIPALIKEFKASQEEINDLIAKINENILKYENDFTNLSNEAKELITEVREFLATAQASENTRISNETTRENNEDVRKNNETARGTNEDTRKANESTRTDDENKRLAAELIRNESENTRLSSETVRVTNENKRIDDETIRGTNENQRQTDESSRADSETKRQANEVIRGTSEDSRAANELTRNNNEDTRIANETLRQTNTATAITNCETATANTNTAIETANEKAQYAQEQGSRAEQALQDFEFRTRIIDGGDISDTSPSKNIFDGGSI